MSLFCSGAKTAAHLREALAVRDDLLRRLSAHAPQPDIAPLQTLWTVHVLFMDWLQLAATQAINAADPTAQQDAADFILWLIEPLDASVREQARRKFLEITSALRGTCM